jgi:hypothetical protein
MLLSKGCLDHNPKLASLSGGVCKTVHDKAVRGAKLLASSLGRNRAAI